MWRKWPQRRQRRLCSENKTGEREGGRQKATKDEMKMSVISRWQNGERGGKNIQVQSPREKKPCGGEAAQHHFNPKPYFSLKRRDGRLRGCVHACVHTCCFFSLFFAPVETKKVAQRLIQFRTTATPTPLWLIKWENVIVNFVGICIYIAAAVPVVTALKIWVPIPGLPSLTSGTSHVTESGIHVHIPSLNVAQCWRMWKSNMTSSIIL